jgi:hypothetical protein
MKNNLSLISVLKLNFRFRNYFFYTALLMTVFLKGQLAPGVEWRRITAPPLTYNGNPQTIDKSGEDWWYAHNNIYGAGGTLRGYVMVGYTSLVTTTLAGQTYTDQVALYNEGSGSPFNSYTASPTYTEPGKCEEMDYVGEYRPWTRGQLGRADAQGNMLWCRSRTINDLQQVIQDPNDTNIVYVVGAHAGVTAYNNHTLYLPYNRTATTTADYFSVSQLGAGYVTTGRSHMYIAKIDISVTGGSTVWEGIYGFQNYGSTSADHTTAYNAVSLGMDIIYSSGSLIAVGNAVNYPFIITVDPTNGRWINKTALIGTFNNSTGYSVNGQANGITEIPGTGDYALACAYLFANSGTNDANRAYVWRINSGLTPSTWSINPICFPGSASSGTVTLYNSNTWQVKYHQGLNQLLVPVIKDCEVCYAAGGNSGQGFVYRLNPATGTLSSGTNPSTLGDVRAFDLRIGIAETADGGFVAVSSTRPPWGYHSTVPSMSACPQMTPDFNQFWDTDGLLVKYNSNGTTIWSKTFDATPAARTRQAFPGDFKLEECLYKVTQTPDGGYVMSGNTSFNFDDNYLAKIYPECNPGYDYGLIGGTTLTASTTWTASKTIIGQIIIEPGVNLTISGSNTKIRFADSKRSGVETNIIVQPGARLDIINGAEVTSISKTVGPNSMWDGIFVAGNTSGNQSYSLGFATYQGLVSITNATISNARAAISTYSPGASIYSNHGGIVSASGSDFVNNVKDVVFLDYNTALSKSVFTNCRFLTTDKLNNEDPVEGHVSLWGMRGVKFNSCTFGYSAGSDYPELLRGYAIYSNDSKYDVTGCSNPPSCSSTVQSVFDNLTSGVIAINTDPNRVVNVEDANFNNIYKDGITLSGISGASISRNTFTVGPLQTSSGVYVDNCKLYNITNNAFTGTDGTTGVGVYASRSYTGGHFIYNNSFSNLYMGIVPQYNNSGPTNVTDGLKMNCNDFTSSNNTFDIIVMGSEHGEVPSVAKTQGAPTPDPKKLVRNRYGATCSINNKWYIEAWPNGKTVEHASNSDINTRPNYSGNCADPLVVVSGTTQAYNSLHCPSNIAGRIPKGAASYSLVNAAFVSGISSTGTLLAFYTSTVDKGNTQQLLDSIYMATSSPTRIKNLLIAASPYLSDTVMSTYFGTASPTNVIAVHNANAPVNPNPWQVILDAGGFSPTETGILESQQVSAPISVRQNLDGELSLSRMELEAIFCDKLNYFLNDSLPASQDSAISMLAMNRGNIPDAPIRLIHALKNNGNYNRAFEVVDSLSAFDDFEELMGIEQALLELDTTQAKIYSILTKSTLNDIIREYAADTINQGYNLARAVLLQVNRENPYLPHLIPEAGLRKMSLQSKGEVNTKSRLMEIKKISGLKVYPNPANESFTIIYSDLGNCDLNFKINDLLGKVLQEGHLNRGTSLEIKTVDFKEGLYIICIEGDNFLLDQQKLVIMK